MKKYFSLLLILSFHFIPLFAQQSELYWIKLGDGVQYASTDNYSGNNIFIGFGGWNTKQELVNNWCYELYKAKLKEIGVQNIFSVKGPDKPCYDDREIDLNVLAEYVKNMIKASFAVDKIIIAAHSSGSFVAHDLLEILYGNNGIATDSIYLNKIYYFNLDGGIGGSKCGVELKPEVVNRLAKVYAVVAYDPLADLYSQNIEAMKKLTELFKDKSELLTLDVTGSGCFAPWCMHETVITKKPHNPEKFDLEKDYGLFDDAHPVQTDYLEVLLKQEVPVDTTITE